MMVTRRLMVRVVLRFYAHLNDFLAAERRQVPFAHTVHDGATVGQVCASLEVPLGEISLLLVNGESVSPHCCLRDGDRVSVYPTFTFIDVSSMSQADTRPYPGFQFVLDTHLGKLAHHLRMLGFDAKYRNDYAPTDLLDIARGDGRILLSKSRRVVEMCETVGRYRVRSSDPREQLIEILRRFDLWTSPHPFQRCLLCNSSLRPIAKEEIIDRLPQKVRQLTLDFNQCPSCERIYWHGTHVRRMKAFIKGLDDEWMGSSVHDPNP